MSVVAAYAPQNACSMIVRKAEPTDVALIAATLHDAFAEFEPLYTPAGFRATTPTAVEIEGRFAEGPIWVVESAGKVLGTVSVVRRGLELYIRSMGVRLEARGQGVGALLLETVEVFAAEHQYRRLTLTTTPFLLAAIQLYERCGFRHTGEQSNLHGTPLLTMVKELSA